MKAIAMSILALSMSGAALANNAKCRSLTNNWNTHPHVACPDFAAFCTTELLSGDMVMETRSGETINFTFGGERQYGVSDMGRDIYNDYSSADGLNMEVWLESDNGYPRATRTGGYTGDVTLFTGVQGRSGVYVSQICGYKMN